jgi:putative endonuclease
MASGKATGPSGEAIARRYLEAGGMQTIETNWRCAAGEIDIVMLDNEVLVFVEVKARTTRIAGAAEEAISPAKASRLLAAGEWYVSEHETHAERLWRIDLLAITMGAGGRIERVTHLQNVVLDG